MQHLCPPRVVKVFKFLKLPPLSNGNYNSHITPSTLFPSVPGLCAPQMQLVSSGVGGILMLGLNISLNRQFILESNKKQSLFIDFQQTVGQVCCFPAFPAKGEGRNGSSSSGLIIVPFYETHDVSMQMFVSLGTAKRGHLLSGSILAVWDEVSLLEGSP